MARWKVLAWLGAGAFGAPLVLKLSGATLDDDAAFVLVFALPFCVFMGLMWSLDVNMSRRAPWGALAIFSTFLSAALGILWLAPAPTPVAWSEPSLWLSIATFLGFGFFVVLGWFRLLTRPRAALARESGTRAWLLALFVALIVLFVALDK